MEGPAGKVPLLAIPKLAVAVQDMFACRVYHLSKKAATANSSGCLVIMCDSHRLAKMVHTHRWPDHPKDPTLGGFPEQIVQDTDRGCRPRSAE